MGNPERDDFKNLRRALERLAQQLYDATHALSRLSTHLKDATGDPYVEHGTPFGTSRAAAEIWHKYRQFTTPN